MGFLYLFNPLCACLTKIPSVCVCVFHKTNVQYPTRVCYNISVYFVREYTRVRICQRKRLVTV